MLQQPRLYQQTILNTAIKHNTLVVLPTGLGKTLIALLLARYIKTKNPESKIVFLSPTKPLTEQHYETFKSLFKEEEMVVFTGTTPPEKRMSLWNDKSIIFCTPQTLENDIINKAVSLKDVGLMVFDEAHRAVGDYAYRFIAEKYHTTANFPKILALTASPGDNKEKILEICKNLKLDAIEARSDKDPDVIPYIKGIDINWVEVNLPEGFQVVRSVLTELLHSRLNTLKESHGIHIPKLTKKIILEMQSKIRASISSGEGRKDAYRIASLLASVLKIMHALELLETQGLHSLKKYINSLYKQSSKAVKELISEELFKKAILMIEDLDENFVEHPKLDSLKKIIKDNIKNNKEKFIIFTQYRDQANKIKQMLDNEGVSNKIFIGQAKKEGKGLSQKEQKEVLNEFSSGGFQVLVCTSVGEEGLDIPKVDTVIFYEPVPSAIRTVQRRGRTGRLEKGKVFVLVTKGTTDSSYRWVAHHKEKKMYRAIDEVKRKFPVLIKENDIEEKKVKTLKEYTKDTEEEPSTIIKADYREKNSPVLKKLLEKGADVRLEQLSVGDYLISDRVVIEYKTGEDFATSIIDGRLLQQLKELIKYTKPLILVEGWEAVFSSRNIHPNAILGMLATISVSYGIPVIFTRHSEESASFINLIAKREQIGGSDFQYHYTKPLTDKELQEYIVSSLPGIGTNLAKPLLKHFGNIRNVFLASSDQLKEIPLIGDKKAKKITEILDKEYKEQN